MKTTSFRLFVILLLVATFATMGATPGFKHLISTSFTGVETFGPVIDPGTVTPKGDMLIIRGLVQIAEDANTDPRVSGENIIEINANFVAATFSGPMWGKAHLKNASGEWDVTWVGKRTPEGHSSIRAWGRGEGGYKGLFATWKYTRSNPDPNAPMDISGFILEARR